MSLPVTWANCLAVKLGKNNIIFKMSESYGEALEKKFD
jgi:hypothetical protein